MLGVVDWSVLEGVALPAKLRVLSDWCLEMEAHIWSVAFYAFSQLWLVGLHGLPFAKCDLDIIIYVQDVARVNYCNVLSFDCF